jgi:hypothetical protein
MLFQLENMNFFSVRDNNRRGKRCKQKITSSTTVSSTTITEYQELETEISKQDTSSSSSSSCLLNFQPIIS